jgi:hypothetical protein
VLILMASWIEVLPAGKSTYTVTNKVCILSCYPYSFCVCPSITAEGCGLEKDVASITIKWFSKPHQIFWYKNNMNRVVYTIFKMNMAAFWVAAPCSLVDYSSPWWWRQQGPLKRW